MPIPKKVLFPSISTLFLILSFQGCSMYQNVTGYFNTYYNAERLFSSTVAEANKTLVNSKLTDTSFFPRYKLPANLKSKFDSVITKSSKLIQFYPKSKLVDDGLVMIGKSYVYLDENDAAIRKFEELFENYPSSGLRLDGRLWYAKALYWNAQPDRSLEELADVIEEALTEGEDEIAIEARLLKGQIDINRQAYDDAAKTYAEAVQGPGDDRNKAIAQFQEAFCHETMEEFEQAAAKYALVREFEPDPRLDYRSRLRQAIMERKAGQYDRSLETLDDLRQENLQKDDKAFVELHIGNTYREMDDTLRAFRFYRAMDSLYKGTDATAQSYFERAVLYETKYNDLPGARKFYEKARTEFPASTVAPIAREKVASLDRYLAALRSFTKHDSLLKLVTDTTWSDSTDSSLITDSLGGRDSLQLATLFADSTSELVKNEPEPDIRVEEALTEEELSDSARIAEAQLEMDRMLPPLAPEMQLHDQALTLDSISVLNKRTFPGDSASVAVDSTLKNPTQAQRPKLSADSLHALIIRSEFEIASIFLLELELPDSARAWYERVLDDPASDFVPQSLYALAETYRDSQTVDSLHALLIEEYPESPFAQHLLKLSGDADSEAPLDSNELRFREAELLMASDNLADAKLIFVDLAMDTASAAFSSKSLYTLGWIYENVEVKNDSAAMYYKRLLSWFPNSVYASDALPRVSVRDDTTTLSRFIKIKEVAAIPKPAGPQRQSKAGAKDAPLIDDEEIDPRSRRNRNDRNIDDEDTLDINPPADRDDEEADPDLEDVPDEDDPPVDDDDGG